MSTQTPVVSLNAQALIGLLEVLSEIEDYLDERADAEGNGPADYAPNREMRLLTDLRQALTREDVDRLVEQAAVICNLQRSLRELRTYAHGALSGVGREVVVEMASVALGEEDR